MSKSTIVVGDSLPTGTVPYLRRRLKGKVKANVVVGRSSTDTVTALRQALKQGSYDRIVFDAGTNDGSARDLRRSLRQVRRLADGTPVYVATVRGPAAAAKNRVIRNTDGVEVIDWAGRSDGLVAGDGIHATPQGYRKRSRMVARALRRGSQPGQPRRRQPREQPDTQPPAGGMPLPYLPSSGSATPSGSNGYQVISAISRPVPSRTYGRQ